MINRHLLVPAAFAALTGACGKGGAPAAPAAPAPAAEAITWSSNATAYRTRLGQQITVTCPPNGQTGSVWGTDTYSDDSSICTAALHSGRVTQAAGGTVTIQIAPGMPSYTASMRNGVTTRPWPAWQGSFTIVGGAAPGLVAQPVGAEMPTTPPPPPPGAGGPPSTITWTTQGSAVAPVGQSAVVGCPPGGTAGTVWGTDVYTDDSSVCTAALHAGLVQLATGGVVQVTGLPGIPAYVGSMRNGVTTRNYGTWPRAFRVEPAGAGAIPPPPPAK